MHTYPWVYFIILMSTISISFMIFLLPPEQCHYCSNDKLGGSNSPRVETFSVSITSTLSQHRESKMNVVACVQLTFQVFTLQTKIYTLPEPVFQTWDRKCLVSIAQMVKVFGMNPKVGGLSAPRVEIISVSKTSTLSQTSVRESKMNAVACAKLTFQMLSLLTKIPTSFIITLLALEQWHYCPNDKVGITTPHL